MAKLTDLQKGRNDGIDFSLRIIKKAAAAGQDPVEALEKEYKYRNVNHIGIPAQRAEIEKFQNECLERALKTCYSASSVILAMTLRDALGFGKARILSVLNRYLKKLYCLDQTAPGCVTFEDYCNCIKEETGIDFLAGSLTDVGITNDTEEAKYRRQQLYGGGR